MLSDHPTPMMDEIEPHPIGPTDVDHVYVQPQLNVMELSFELSSFQSQELAGYHGDHQSQVLTTCVCMILYPTTPGSLLAKLSVVSFPNSTSVSDELSRDQRQIHPAEVAPMLYANVYLATVFSSIETFSAAITVT